MGQMYERTKSITKKGCKNRWYLYLLFRPSLLLSLTLFPGNFFQGMLEFSLFKEYLDEKSSIDRNAIPWWQRFEIKHYKSNTQKSLPNQNKFLGLIIHKRLAEALKLDKYIKEHLLNHSSHFD